MKEKGKKTINFILYIIYVSIYLYVVRKYGMGSEDSKIRYYALVFIIVFGFISFLLISLKKGGIKLKEKKFLLSLFVSFLFLVFSYNKVRSVGATFDSRTIIQIFLFLLPTIYAFVAINLFSKEEIVKMFKFTTIALILTYFMEENHSISQIFNLSNWLNIDIIHSSSFTESHLCARCFTILFLFFNYTYWTDKENNNKKYLILTFIFTVLCFKRMDILVAIFTFLFGKYFSFKAKTGSKKIIIATIVVALLTIFYLDFLSGNVLKNVNVYELTSGRDRILRLWSTLKFFSYGYGTSMLVIGRSLELDLIQMYLEMNIFALLSFVFTYLYFTKNNIYSFFIMLYVLFNMLLASSLANTLSWIILMLTIAFISSNSNDKENGDGKYTKTAKKI